MNEVLQCYSSLSGTGNEILPALARVVLTGLQSR